MKKTPLIILSVYMIAAFAGVTFAWMSPPKSPKGDYAVLEYGEGTENHLGIQSKDISFKAYAYDEVEETYVPTSSLSDYFTLIPTEYVKMRFDFTNTTSSVYKLKLQICNITTDSYPYSEEPGDIPPLFNYIYFGINNATGYNNGYSYTNPVGTYSNLGQSEALYGTYQLTFIESLDITPTNPEDEEHSVVSLYGYVLFSAEAGIEFMDKTISLGTFRVVI